MKLFELITPKSFIPQRLKTPAAVKYRQTLKNTRYNRDLEGNGKFANVYSRDNDPGGVEKVAKPISPVDYQDGTGLRDGLDDDSYYKYLKLISTNRRMMDNPYFPKVFSLKTYKGTDGRYTYNVNLEKLQSLRTLSNEEAKMIGNNLFTNYMGVVKDITKQLLPDGLTQREKEDPEIVNSAYKEIYLQALSDCIQKAISNESEPATYIKDQKLKQAVMLIRALVKKAHPYIMHDAHIGNIMVRRGPFTPQLVLTDPVS